MSKKIRPSIIEQREVSYLTGRPKGLAHRFHPAAGMVGRVGSTIGSNFGLAAWARQVSERAATRTRPIEVRWNGQTEASVNAAIDEKARDASLRDLGF